MKMSIHVRALPLKPFSFFLIGFLLFFSVCAAAVKPPVKGQEFMDHLFRLKGKKVAGTIIYPSGQDTPFKGEKIWLEVKVKGRKQILLPIYRDQQVYRTLILSQDEQGFFLQHENKKPNGLQAEISMYGGHSEGEPSPFLLVFPADGYSKQLLGNFRENVWSLAFNNDRSILSYIAEENGHVTMQIDFDLSEVLQKDPRNLESTIDMPKNSLKKQPALALSGQQ
jgi:hypothetical protein